MYNLFRRVVFFLLLSSLNIGLFGQNDSVTYYFDEYSRLCSEKNASTRAIGKLENDKFKLKVWVKSTNNLYSEGSYTDFTLAVKDGPFIYYYDNGEIKSKGSYVNDKESGYWEYWEGGAFPDSVYYEKGLDVIRITYLYYPDGKLDTRVSNNALNRTTEMTIFDKEGNLKTATKWVEGNGDKIFYYSNGQPKIIEKYKNKVVVSTQYFNQEGIKISSKQFNEQEFVKKPSVVANNQIEERTPDFPGGLGGFQSFFSQGFRRPKSVNNDELPQSVTVSFELDKAGFISNIRINGSINRAIENEIINVFRRMPAWNMYGHKRWGPVSVNLYLF